MTVVDARYRREVARRRWRAVRRAVGLADPAAAGFGTGGLARFVRDPSVRLLVLPAEPSARFVEFDEAFWSWWLAASVEIPGRGPVQWGTAHRPTAEAAVRFEESGDARWRHYIAVRRDGGIELGLGRDGTYEWGSHRVFRLVETIERLWAGLALYRDVGARLNAEGPWEVSVGLIGTAGAYLGGFATGWREPPRLFDEERPACPERNLLHSRELDAWPGEDGLRELAFSIGGWMEDAWGSRLRRFLPARGAP